MHFISNNLAILSLGSHLYFDWWLVILQKIYRSSWYNRKTSQKCHTALAFKNWFFFSVSSSHKWKKTKDVMLDVHSTFVHNSILHSWLNIKQKKKKKKKSIIIINFLFEIFINSLLEMVKSILFLPLKWQVSAPKNILFGLGFYPS